MKLNRRLSNVEQKMQHHNKECTMTVKFKDGYTVQHKIKGKEDITIVFAGMNGHNLSMEEWNRQGGVEDETPNTA